VSDPSRMSPGFELLEHVPIPSYVFRVHQDDFILESVNAAGRALNPALVGLCGSSMTHLYQDQPQAIADAQRCVAERTSVVREMPVRRYDRTEATQYLRLVYTFVAPAHMVIYMQDIATPRVAEAALRESEARYRSLFTSLPDAVILRGADGRVLACNDVAVRLLGIADQLTLLGRQQMISPGYRVQTEGGAPVVEADLPSLRVIRTGRPELGQVYALISDSGAVRWLRVAAQPIISANGGISGSVTTLTDVTDRAEAQRALRESAARLDLALAAAKMGVWEYDPRTKLGWWSDNLYEIFQYGPSRLRTLEGFLTRVHPDDRAAFAAIAEAAEHGRGETFEFEFRVLGVDNVTRWARSRGRSSQEAGELRLVGTIMDVTEQHALEEELRRAHRLESIGRLAGGVAHDFNNLLAAMMGSIELVEEHCPESAREDLATIRHCALRARDLTRQLLAFARKQPAEYKVIDLSALVTDVERMLRRLVGSNVEMVISSSGPVYVRADASLLEQVLVNLVVNAREAMPEGGRLDVRVERSAGTSADGTPTDKFALVEISDSGVGMDDETRLKIFEPFFTTRSQGTGLGLASSYGIVKQHGGDVAVESSPGGGTRFRILIPRVESPATAAVSPTAPALVTQGSGWVLVIDDEPLVRNTTVRMLQSLGYNVLSAGSAAEGLERSRAHPGPIDVLLCDVAMPGQDGPSVALELQRLRPELKVVFASGYAPRTFALGDAAFLQKPYGRADLAAKLQEIKR
jgi:two-component system, cell cycle sensor histidine kinase and response regulator CckA